MKPADPHTMTLVRFGELVEAYGARPERWPEAERFAAQRLIANDAAAARLWQSAQALDDALDAYSVPPASARLRARVLEVPALAARNRRKFAVRVAWAVALSCVLGVLSGALTAPEESADDEWSELAQLSAYPDSDLAAWQEDEP